MNGVPAVYFFDTGSWFNAMSESEAKRLGLRFTSSIGSTATMTNRTALLQPGQRGLLGMPVILAFRTLRWAQDGTIRIGDKPAPFDVRGANLLFDSDHLALTIGFQGRAALGAVDTGAESTDLYHQFAVQFPSAMESGKKGTTKVRGVGGAESYESVTLPEIVFKIGATPMVLRSQDVLMNRDIRSYIGNFGMDVFRQGRALKFDSRPCGWR